MGHFAGLKWDFRALNSSDRDIFIWKYILPTLFRCSHTFIYDFDMFLDVYASLSIKYLILGHFAGLKWGFRAINSSDRDRFIWKHFLLALFRCSHTFIYDFDRFLDVYHPLSMKYPILGHFAALKRGFRGLNSRDLDIFIWKCFLPALIKCSNTFIYNFH